MNNPHHIWQRMTLPHSGSSTLSGRWFHTDNPETYASQGNKEFGLEDVYYHINSLGYRTKEFSEINHNAFKILVLGCSMTLGVGLPIEATYGEQLAQLLRDTYRIDVEIINMGMGGRSMDYITRLLFQSLPILQPNYVFCLFPHLSRREYIHNQYEIITAEFFYSAIVDKQPHDEAILLLSNDEWDFFSFVKNISFIELMLQDYHWSWDCWDSLWDWQEQRHCWPQYFDTTRYRQQYMLGVARGRARDNMHFGRPYHHYIAQDLFSDIHLQQAIHEYFDEPIVF
jgi:hypothetical protein